MPDRFLAECLRRGRERRGLTQLAVVVASGRPIEQAGQVSRIERGVNPLHEATFASYARALGASPRELLLEQLVEHAVSDRAREPALRRLHADAIVQRAALLDERGIFAGLLRRLRIARGGARLIAEGKVNLSEASLETVARDYLTTVPELLAAAFLAPEPLAPVAVDLEPLRAAFVARVTGRPGEQGAALAAIGVEKWTLSRFRTGGPLDDDAAAKLAAWLAVPPLDQAALRAKAIAKATRTGSPPTSLDLSTWRRFRLGDDVKPALAQGIAAWVAE